MKLSSRAYNLYEAFAKPGCPVCRLAVDSVHHYLDSVIYEYVTKPHTHEGLRAARGFCQQHAWHVIAESMPARSASPCCTRDCFAPC